MSDLYYACNIAADLNKYMFMEKVSILEQAVWKHATIVETMEKLTGVQAIVMCNGGWKNHKAENRHHSTIHIIVLNVMPFIEK